MYWIMFLCVVLVMMLASVNGSKSITDLKARIRSIEEESCGIDVGFVMDSSSSISKADYKVQKEFVKAVTSRADISKGTSQAGVIIFSNFALHLIRMNQYTTNPSFNRAVDRLLKIGGGTRIDKGLRLAQRRMFSFKNDGKSVNGKLLVLITDGAQTVTPTSEDPAIIARELRSNLRINVIVVGIGSGVDAKELEKIADGSENLFLAKDFKQLVSDAFVRRVQERACKVNGNWGAWVPLEECPVTCGGGMWRRKRSCDNPRSSFGGLDCLLTGGGGKRGKQEEGVHPCNTQTCLAPTSVPAITAVPTTVATVPSTAASTAAPTTTTTTAATVPSTLAPTAAPTTSAATVPPKCGNIDLGFVIDSSGSISKSEYENEKKFVKSMTAMIGFGNNKMRASVITFGNKASHDINLNDHTAVTSFAEALDAIPKFGSDTRIDIALKLAQKKLFVTGDGKSRSNRYKIMILLTDGSQTITQDSEDPSVITEEIRRSGVNVLVVGMGAKMNPSLLVSMAGGYRKLYRGTQVTYLLSDEFKNSLSELACQEPKATSAPVIIPSSGHCVNLLSDDECFRYKKREFCTMNNPYRYYMDILCRKMCVFCRSI